MNNKKNNNNKTLVQNFRFVLLLMGQLDLVCDLKTIRRLNIMYDRYPLSIIESLIVD